MGIDGHQALALQLPQSFAHRNPAQSELRRQLVLAQRLAALEHAAHNGVAQHVRDHARRRAPAADGLGIELADTHGGIIYWIQCLSKDLSVAVSNAMWRDARTYPRDFAAMGIGPYVDAVVSSVEIGFRKPHRAMFEAALAVAHRPPQHCVMIGNSEQSDIQPALALG